MNLHPLLSISPVVPVVTIRDARQAVPAARALQDGGVGVIEVTLRTVESTYSMNDGEAALLVY